MKISWSVFISFFLLSACGHKMDLPVANATKDKPIEPAGNEVEIRSSFERCLIDKMSTIIARDYCDTYPSTRSDEIVGSLQSCSDSECRLQQMSAVVLDHYSQQGETPVTLMTFLKKLKICPDNDCRITALGDVIATDYDGRYFGGNSDELVAAYQTCTDNACKLKKMSDVVADDYHYRYGTEAHPYISELQDCK